VETTFAYCMDHAAIKHVNAGRVGLRTADMLSYNVLTCVFANIY
jgi:hypothetical protein